MPVDAQHEPEAGGDRVVPLVVDDHVRLLANAEPREQPGELLLGGKRMPPRPGMLGQVVVEIDENRPRDVSALIHLPRRRPLGRPAQIGNSRVRMLREPLRVDQQRRVRHVRPPDHLVLVKPMLRSG